MLILYGEDQSKQVQGDAIVESILRTSLEPIPVTFEGIIRLDPEIAEHLTEGKDICVGRDKVKVRIVYAKNITTDIVQDSQFIARKIIALHSQTHSISFRLKKAVFRESVSLSEVYKACGASTVIGKDFIVSRFYGYQGDVPSEQIAKICQEEGGVVCWSAEDNRVEFIRINTMFNQKPKVLLPTMADETQRSGFLERHQVPAYISIDKAGAIIMGDFSKPRNVSFSPHKNSAQLYAMSQVLINAKEVPCEFSPDINAGDLIEIDGVPFVIITAAHESSLRVGGQSEQRSHFWLGVKA